MNPDSDAKNDRTASDNHVKSISFVLLAWQCPSKRPKGKFLGMGKQPPKRGVGI